MSAVGRVLRRTLFPVGSVATIRRGPLRGCRYRITEEAGWAPVLGRREPEAQRAYIRLVRPGDVVWDLGANTGIHTLLFARLAGSNGQVVAFEPLHVNARQVSETCALNAMANVAVVEKAVSDSTETQVFRLGNDDKQGSLVGIGCEDGTVMEVACTTLDAFLDHARHPDFVKIDIEGAESRALRGFERVVESFPTFAIDLHTPSEDVAVGLWLRSHGYRVFRLLDGTARAHGTSAREFTSIPDLGRGWPDPDGMWGTAIAVHPSRAALLAMVLAG